MNELMQKYYFYCLKADLPSAIKVIEKSKNKLPNVNSKKFFSKVKARFILQNEKSRLKCEDNFVKEVIESYRRYYRAALLDRFWCSKRLTQWIMVKQGIFILSLTLQISL